MRILYLECNMGVAGDMLTGALLDLFENPQNQIGKLNAIGIPGVEYIMENSEKCGIKGLHIKVLINGEEEKTENNVHDKYCNEHEHNHEHSHEHNHEHSHEHSHGHKHASMEYIENIINNLKVAVDVKKQAIEIYKNIASAEGKVHGKDMWQVHFHEVGSMDAIADVVGTCYLLKELNVEKIFTSPIRLGYGHVNCAHGILPVPAPAVALLVQGIPVYNGNIEGEFCTPTGAALIKYFTDEYGNMPVMRLEKTGYGMGNKNFEYANCVRAHLGEIETEYRDIIVELRCNIDDMTAEDIGYATELLMQAGALDVYTLNIQMKKNRPGIMLCCMCRHSQKTEFTELIFKHTSTIGIREYECGRYTLNRENLTIDTQYGVVHAKKSTGYGVKRLKLEYEDIAKIAKERNLALNTVRENLKIYDKE